MPAAPADPGVALVTALEKAHAAVRHHGRGREVEGMATTAVAVLVSGWTATVAHDIQAKGEPEREHARLDEQGHGTCAVEYAGLGCGLPTRAGEQRKPPRRT